MEELSIEEQIKRNVMAADKEKLVVKDKENEVRRWCLDNLSPEQGIVETKLFEDMTKGYIFIYTYRGRLIKHRTIPFEEMGIDPLPELKYITSDAAYRL